MQAPSWRFRAIDEDQKHVEPTHREHLAPGGAVDPLVRESIQNSLDVTVEGRPTKICFTLGQAAPHQAASFFQSLQPHLAAITKSLPEGLPDNQQPVRYLAIEDFNTSGLVGDPALRDQFLPDGSKNHFFRFWHSVGQSSGDFKRRGSWGVGKVVFSNASSIRTFFGVTLRAGETAPIMMGEAGLTIHKLPGDGRTYDWYGYYAAHEVVSNRHALRPINGSDVSDFCSAFTLSRTQPGLSIVVPYVRAEVNLNDLARAVVEQYFLPIVAGRLEVCLRDHTRRIEITRSQIDTALNQIWSAKDILAKSEMAALLGVTRWQLGLGTNDYTLLGGVGGEFPYSLERTRFPAEALARMSRDFAANKRIAIRIPVHVRPLQGVPSVEHVSVV